MEFLAASLEEQAALVERFEATFASWTSDQRCDYMDRLAAYHRQVSNGELRQEATETKPSRRRGDDRKSGKRWSSEEDRRLIEVVDDANGDACIEVLSPLVDELGRSMQALYSRVTVLRSAGKLPAKDAGRCPHGECPAECDDCMRQSDEAFDAAREQQLFGGGPIINSRRI